MVPSWYIDAGGLLWLAVLAVGAGWVRSFGRRRGMERCALVRRQARARAEAGMPPGHLEVPGLPGGLELLRYGGVYDYFAAQLADIEVKDQ